MAKRLVGQPDVAVVEGEGDADGFVLWAHVVLEFPGVAAHDDGGGEIFFDPAAGCRRSGSGRRSRGRRCGGLRGRHGLGGEIVEVEEHVEGEDEGEEDVPVAEDGEGVGHPAGFAGAEPGGDGADGEGESPEGRFEEAGEGGCAEGGEEWEHGEAEARGDLPHVGEEDPVEGDDEDDGEEGADEPGDGGGFGRGDEFSFSPPAPEFEEPDEGEGEEEEPEEDVGGGAGEFPCGGGPLVNGADGLGTGGADFVTARGGAEEPAAGCVAPGAVVWPDFCGAFAAGEDVLGDFLHLEVGFAEVEAVGFVDAAVFEPAVGGFGEVVSPVDTIHALFPVFEAVEGADVVLGGVEGVAVEGVAGIPEGSGEEEGGGEAGVEEGAFEDGGAAGEEGDDWVEGEEGEFGAFGVEGGGLAKMPGPRRCIHWKRLARMMEPRKAATSMAVATSERVRRLSS